MSQFFSQRSAWIAVGLLVIYVAVAAITPPEYLKRLMDAGRFGFALAVTIVCARPAFDVMKYGARERSDQVVVAVWLVWAVTTFAALWIPMNREIVDMPSWVPRDQITALIPYLYMISAAFFLIPIGNGREDLPAGNWPMILVAAVVGAAAVGTMFGFGLGRAFG